MYMVLDGLVVIQYYNTLKSINHIRSHRFIISIIMTLNLTNTFIIYKLFNS